MFLAAVESLFPTDDGSLFTLPPPENPHDTAASSSCSTTSRASGAMPPRGQLESYLGHGKGGVGEGAHGLGREGGVGASDAEHLYLRGRAPGPGGCRTGKRCPRCSSARPPPPSDAPGGRHASTETFQTGGVVPGLTRYGFNISLQL